MLVGSLTLLQRSVFSGVGAGAGLESAVIQGWRDLVLLHQELLTNMLNSASNI